jgi:hypothetical protein
LASSQGLSLKTKSQPLAVLGKVVAVFRNLA